MGWIFALVLIVPLMLDAVATTFVLLVLLNGYPSLPDVLVNLYLASAVVLIPGLSWLAGRLAQTWAGRGKISVGLAGLAAGAAALVVLPLALVAVTLALLMLFGML